MDKRQSKNYLKDNKGITLISLVVTIIVLIVLAVVSINLVVGDNGILTKANVAKIETRGSSVEERVNLWKFEKDIDMYSQDKVAQEIQELLNNLENEKLITEEERKIIEETGKVTIGTRTIVFDETKIDTSTELDWEKIKEEANKNPEKYAHPNQSSTNKDLAIGTDGKAVNMDLWKYTVMEGKIVLIGETVGSGAISNCYKGMITEEGKIEGTIPQYIKPDGYDEFLEVVMISRLFDVYELHEEIYKIKELVIPETVIAIESGTFYGCSGLTEIKIPNSVIYLGEDAFRGCTSLKQIEIPNAVVRIGGAAFYECRELTEIKIPSSVEYIGEYAFFGCSTLTEITIPDSVTSLGRYAFYGCSKLNQVKMSSGITEIEENMFSNCINLKQIEIPNTVVSIDDAAFSGCIGLNQITIPSSVTSLESHTFYGCTGLTQITIPNNITEIQSYVFLGCTGLTEITIPSSVTSIWDAPFESCTNLEKIIVDEKNLVFDSRENCNAIIETSTNELVQGCKNSIIPNGITSIERNAFSNMGLKEINIPNSLKYIRQSAFYNCKDITEITIPESVTIIGKNAFYGWTSNQTINIKTHTSAPSKWDANWNQSCDAVIKFAQ